jgi:UTP--glucose-1-phosphate uridylyltransferase
MIFVTGRNKRAIEDHFDKAYELETELERKGKNVLLENGALGASRRRALHLHPPGRAARPRPCGALRPARGRRRAVRGGARRRPDGFEPPALARMAQIFERQGSSLLGVEEVPRDQTQSYGIVTIDKMDGDQARIHSIVEKPKPADAPSNLAVIGRYVLTPRIFDLLAEIPPGAGGEIQLTDAISELLVHERVLAVRLPGRRFDCGSKLGYLQATIELGLRHPDIGKDFAKYLKGRNA